MSFVSCHLSVPFLLGHSQAAFCTWVPLSSYCSFPSCWAASSLLQMLVCSDCSCMGHAPELVTGARVIRVVTGQAWITCHLWNHRKIVVLIPKWRVGLADKTEGCPSSSVELWIPGVEVWWMRIYSVLMLPMLAYWVLYQITLSSSRETS